MSIKEKCAAGVRDAYGQDMSDAEIEDFVADIELRAKYIRAKETSLSMTDALERAAKEKGDKIQMAAVAKKRATLIGYRRAFERVDYISTQFAGRESEGLYTKIVGTEGGEFGSRSASGLEQETLHSAYFADLGASLSKVSPNIARDFKDKKFQLDVAEAMARISDEAKDFSDLNPLAVQYGQAISKVRELARRDHNAAGGAIGKTKGYVASQSFWDPINITKDKAAFREMMRQRWDWAEMGYYTQKDIDEAMPFFERNMATGVHLGQPDSIPKAKGLQGMARGLAQERVIYFKSSADYMWAMDKFGHGGLLETVYSDLARLAKSTGMMRHFGPNHIATYDAIVDTVSRRIQSQGRDPSKFIEDSKHYKETFIREQDGSLDIPANELIRTIGTTARVTQNLAHLTNTMTATINDVATMGLNAKWNGQNPVEAMAAGVRGWFEGIPDAAKQETLADMGVYFESMIAGIAKDRGTIDTSVRGILGKGQDILWQMNLQNRMTNGGQNGIAHVMARTLARDAKKSFSSIDAEFRTTLSAYGIDEGKWDIIRSVQKAKDYTGTDIITPSALRDIDSSVWKAYLDNKGVRSTKFAIDELREETFQNLRNYFVDQANYGVLTNSAKTRGIVKGGLQSGTTNGEIRRAVFQFKSFPIEFFHRVMKREFKRGSAATAATRLMVYTASMGIVSGMINDLIKGKNPKALTQNPLATMKDGILRGGGGGIYVDIINTLASGKEPTKAAFQLLGPAAGDAAEIVSLINKGSRSAYYRATGNEDEANKQDFGSALLRFGQSNMPLINQFAVKLAFDYGFMYSWQESLNPGTLDRMEKRMQEDTGQTFMVPPSETVQ